MNLRLFSLFSAVLLMTACTDEKLSLTPSPHDLGYDSLAERWDEAIPLGNGNLGALVWEKDGMLRISLDRSDLWDLRPMDNIGRPEWKFSWVYEQWKNDNYGVVQEYFDLPTSRDPAPSKIPAGALELDVTALGAVDTVMLFTHHAVCEVRWENGAALQVYVHATDPVGWFRFTGLPVEVSGKLVPPAYNLEGENNDASIVTGQDLRRLGYPRGKVEEYGGMITYDQEGWGGFQYQVSLRSEQTGKRLDGCWSISAGYPGEKEEPNAAAVVDEHFNKGFEYDYASHREWWEGYWARSSIRIPDRVLEKQYYLEMYKFGSAARNGRPPISLQAVWTADNGKLPPWKGDFHHDLNTQLSYWPAYTGNQLNLETGFLEWLWENKPAFEKYTRQYYGCAGINVPGVTTLAGQPMGGWIQYSFGPTVSAWLGHHFYKHWDFTRDTAFLRERAYPWIGDVATFILALSEVGEDGMRKLPLSSSPEIYDNSPEAWFAQTTNFDLALIRHTFLRAGELAAVLGLEQESRRWYAVLEEWPGYSVDDENGLNFAPGVPYAVSHRHFSHLMAFHPLGLVDYSNGPEDRAVIDRTLAALEKYGPDWWTGYSYSWLGNLRARAFDGEGAAEALRIFATAFCLPNSFHVNGDQSGKGYSKFTYRPFTLEGNFAFAAGIQEMLLQSHTGVIRVFPAMPNDWDNVSFTDLRAAGAFLVSARMEQGKVVEVEVRSEKGGPYRMVNPFHGPFEWTGVGSLQEGDTLMLELEAQQTVRITKK
jgi:alpha-L-fucosidase 2